MSEVQPEMGEDSRLPWTNVTSVSLHFYAYHLCMYVCMYVHWPFKLFKLFSF